MATTYLENCIDAVAAADVESLAASSFGEVLGKGSGFEFRSLGKLALYNALKQYIGVKVLTSDKNDATLRLVSELPLISIILDSSPELLSKVPSFMALVSVEGEDSPRCIITEDTSEGGYKRVRGKRASQEVRDLLFRPFQELGSFDEVVNEDECNRSLSFDVGGEEKLLDFTPTPINQSLLYSYSPFKTVRSEMIDAIPDLTITIPRESTFAKYLIQ